MSALGQLQDPSKMSAGKLKRAAENAERYGDVFTAIKYLGPYTQKKVDDAEAAYHLAELLEKTRDYQEAGEAYLKAFNKDNSNPEAFIKHAQMLILSGNPQEAKIKFQEFEDMIRKNGYSGQWRKIVKDYIESCERAIELISNPIEVEISHFGEAINGPHAEFAPLALSKDEIVFGAIKENEIRYFHLDSLTPRRRLYKSEKVGGIWMNAELWDVPFNAGPDHIANGTFNPLKTLFAYTRCEENRKNETTCALYLIRLENGKWGDPEKFDERINVPGFVVSQPALAYDQKKDMDILYFASNRTDGQGGMDIWYTVFDKRRNEWKKPKSVGRRINGPGDEMTPYYSHKDKKLYFSSNSMPGVGGLDVFSARGELQRFSVPQNLGYPLNSSVDELYFVLKDDRESGYFISNRKGGFQMLNETCCDDLYEFRFTDIIHLGIEGFVMEVDESDYVKGDGDVLLAENMGNDFLDGVDVELYLLEGDQEVLMDKTVTKGDGKYFLDFEPEKKYKVVLSREGYFSNHIDIDTYNRTVSDTIFQNVGLSPMTASSIVIDNILFDFDSSNLTEESKKIIDRGILNTMIENPLIIVELSAHTDDKGDAGYNLKLSQQRAESVTAYLVMKGIETNRLKARGHGETKPIAPNKNPDGSDNPEGRALNRRTEFTILGSLEKPKEVLDEEEEDEVAD